MAGFEVIATLVDSDVASTTEEDLETLLDTSRHHLSERHEADPALSF